MDGGDEAWDGGLVWEEGGDSGSAFDLAVEAFSHVGGAEPEAVALRECEDGEALWEVGFEPLGEVRGSFLVCGDQFCQASLCVSKVRGVEDGADLSGDLLAQFEVWNEGLCVLLEVELAALPWSGVEGGAQGGPESLVGVGGDEVRNADAAGFEGVEEGAPVGFCLRECAGDPQNDALAVLALDADGTEDGAVTHRTVEADLEVCGVEEEEADFGQRAVAPLFELGVEFGGELGDLSGGDIQAAKLGKNPCDAACGYALEVHFGDGSFQCALRAGTFLEEGGLEWGGTLPDLGNAEVEFSQTCVEGAWLETVGVAVARFGTLVGLGPEVCGALQTHGGIHEHFSDARQGIAKAVFEKGGYRVDGGGIWVWLGHGWCLVDFDTSTFPTVAGHLNFVRGFRKFYRRNVALACFSSAASIFTHNTP